MQELIGNVTVDFPYKPYKLQKDYMRCVINSCQNEEYALLESPTGTGKTLSLLCSVLSWKRQYQSTLENQPRLLINDEKNINPNPNSNCTTHIIYSSRTHSQLSNVINELKKTVFHPTVSQIASRSRLCLIDDISKHDNSTSQSKKCRLLRRDKKCQFSDDNKINEACSNLLEPLLDIEDFITTCKSMEACPYFVSQKLAEKSDLILMPYTYFVDPSVRVNLSSTIFQGSVLIIDEAHNFPEQCNDYFSFSMQITVFKEISLLLEKVLEPEKFQFFKCHSNFDFTPIEKVSKQLFKLFESFSELSLKIGSQKYIHRKADFWYEILEKSDISSANIRSVVGLLSSFNDENIVYGIDTSLFELLTRFFRSFFPFEKRESIYLDGNFGICLTSDGVFNIFCFSPSIAFGHITDLHPRTIILTSGTISPFDTFAQSLGYEFPIVLENPHIADPKNLLVAVATAGISGAPFHFTFQNRSNTRMKEEFAVCLSEAMKIAPNGFLTFFPSFVFLTEIESILKKSNHSEKAIIIEPRNQRLLKSALCEFNRRASKKQGANLLAVCRGKMSEGLDFSDDFARCVCVVGIPFPNLGDVKVEMHKLWLDSKKKGDGSRWYIEKATRAVNQAIGRAIRHKDDYAAVILFDQRYEGFTGMISKWIQPSIKRHLSWSQIESNLRDFFSYHQKRNDVESVGEDEESLISIEDTEETHNSSSRRTFLNDKDASSAGNNNLNSRKNLNDKDSNIFNGNNNLNSRKSLNDKDLIASNGNSNLNLRRTFISDKDTNISSESSNLNLRKNHLNERGLNISSESSNLNRRRTFLNEEEDIEYSMNSKENSELHQDKSLLNEEEDSEDDEDSIISDDGTEGQPNLAVGKRTYLDDYDDDYFSFNSSEKHLNLPKKKRNSPSGIAEPASSSNSESCSLESSKTAKKMVRFLPQPSSHSGSTSQSASHQSSQTVESETDFQPGQVVPHPSQTVTNSDDGYDGSTEKNSTTNASRNGLDTYRKSDNFYRKSGDLNTNRKSGNLNGDSDDDNTQSEGDEYMTRSQRSIVHPQISKSRIAAVYLKSTMEKDDRKLLCDVLRLFKQTRDIEVLRIGIDALESDECKRIILKTMNSKLKEKFNNDG